MTKKTDKHETVEETIQPKAAETPESAVVQETAAEQDSYTLTAEEFAAAKAHIEAITKEKDETVGLLQRIQADFDNFRRRNEGVRADAFAEGQRKVATAMLPVLDNLERALAAAENVAFL